MPPPDPLDAVFPQTRHVSLAGRRFACGEATLDDLARLQGYLRSEVPDPYAASWEAIHAPGLTGRAKDALLFAVADRASEWPPTPDDERGQEMLSTAEGVAAFLTIALGRHNPGLSTADVAEVVAGVTPAEFSALQRIFYGIGPAESVHRLLFDAGGAGPAKRLTWGEAVMELARVYHWNLSDIGRLTASQVKLALRGGKPAEAGGKVVPLARLQAEREALHMRRFGVPLGGDGPAAVCVRGPDGEPVAVPEAEADDILWAMAGLKAEQARRDASPENHAPDAG
jgi:hypothetical protein